MPRIVRFYRSEQLSNGDVIERMLRRRKADFSIGYLGENDSEKRYKIDRTDVTFRRGGEYCIRIISTSDSKITLTAQRLERLLGLLLTEVEP